MVVPTQSNERWSLDFVSDQLACGRRFRVLNVVDDFSRECVGQLTDVSISGARMARYLSELGAGRDLPRTIVCDNGTEMTSKAMFFWSRVDDDGIMRSAFEIFGYQRLILHEPNIVVSRILRK